VTDWGSSVASSSSWPKITNKTWSSCTTFGVTVARNACFMFHIPLQIALQALIETTTKVWDVFDRRKKEASILKGIADQKKAHGGLSERLDIVEKNQAEQAGLMKEFAERLKEFGEAMQSELETQRKQQMRLKLTAYMACAFGVIGFGMSLYVTLR
jgi:hypothetical protein